MSPRCRSATILVKRFYTSPSASHHSMLTQKRSGHLQTFVREMPPTHVLSFATTLIFGGWGVAILNMHCRLLGLYLLANFFPSPVQNGLANVYIRICLLAYRPLCSSAGIAVSVAVSEPPTTRRQVARRNQGGVEDGLRRG